MLHASFKYCFNSNMVRLKSQFLLRFCLFFFHFNSNMVRLKLSVASADSMTLSKFQFQYGAIKIPTKLYKKRNASNLFQFQYGAIKIVQRALSRFIFFCFNSNMVRLKSQVENLPVQIHMCFNSNMVRLKY